MVAFQFRYEIQLGFANSTFWLICECGFPKVTVNYVDY